MDHKYDYAHPLQNDHVPLLLLHHGYDFHLHGRDQYLHHGHDFHLHDCDQYLHHGHDFHLHGRDYLQLYYLELIMEHFLKHLKHKLRYYQHSQ